MALIGTIRKRGAWILVVLIALGLGGFIIQDMFSGTGPTGMVGQPDLGKVNGEKLDINDFNRTESILYSGASGDIYSRRSALWDYYVEKALIDEAASDLGLGVSKTELIDLQFGAQPSPIIMQRFIDPTTGQVNFQQLTQIRSQIESGTLDPTIRSYWAIQEKEIVKDLLQSKFGAMISKGIYTPTWMAEMVHEEQAREANFEFVRVPFDAIDNTEVSLEDADFKAYLNENAHLYERQEETRRLNYITFNVMPTPRDSATWKQKIADLAAEFRTTDNDTLFIERNLGVMNSVYLEKELISPVIAEEIADLPVGSVYGPYMELNAYKAVKILDRKVIPDSVRSRHILIRASDQLTFINAQNKIDSIKTAIEAGTTTFEAMNDRFNEDVVAKASGGDLDFAAPNMMVQEFNDLIFYQAEPNRLYTVITQFGIHLVEVTDQKFLDQEPSLRLAFISQSIIPTEETQKMRYDEALTFLTENQDLEALEAAVNASSDLVLETSGSLAANDFSIGNLGAGAQSRDMVRWAFTASPGDVSSDVYVFSDEVEYFDNKYVVIALKSIEKPGLPKVDEVRADIEQLVANQKKGELLSKNMTGKSIAEITQEYDVSVDSALNIRFNTAFLPNLGAEPKLIGEAFKLEQGEVSNPIVGNNGVYVVRVLSKTVPSAPVNLAQIRQSTASIARSRVNTGLMDVLKDKAKIVDNRSTFY